jgi:autotransporter-associated beta strand protein
LALASGNNTISGNISTTIDGNIYALQSDSGLLTVAGNWNSASGVTGARYYNLQGAGNGSFTGNISNGAAQVVLTMQGTGTWTLSGSNTYSGGTNVASGTLVLASAPAFPSATNLTVASGATLQIANHSSGNATTIVVGLPTNSGTIDLTNNALDIRTISAGVSDIGTITAQVIAAYNGGAWNGTSGISGVITSSRAANDPTHLTAIGVATGFTSFEGQTVPATDVLVKYTYYGDTNLDGKVDATDYSRIDAAFLADQTSPGSVTGWYNGDFNYDGVINGSDYTLIDNAFNTQSAQIAAEVASPTSQIAGASTSAVPEPASLGIVALGAIGLLGRRRSPRR